MERRVYLIRALWILGFCTVICNAHYSQDKTKQQKSITCYECNSQYDPRCDDPFNSYTIGTVNCSMKKTLDHLKQKPTLCRKAIQIVQGQRRVIRGCGYIPSKYDDKQCIKRTGTHEVEVTYCSCTKSLCNTGHTVINQSLEIVFISSAFMTALTNMLRMT